MMIGPVATGASAISTVPSAIASSERTSRIGYPTAGVSSGSVGETFGSPPPATVEMIPDGSIRRTSLRLPLVGPGSSMK